MKPARKPLLQRHDRHVDFPDPAVSPSPMCSVTVAMRGQMRIWMKSEALAQMIKFGHLPFSATGVLGQEAILSWKTFLSSWIGDRFSFWKEFVTLAVAMGQVPDFAQTVSKLLADFEEGQSSRVEEINGRKHAHARSRSTAWPNLGITLASD